MRAATRVSASATMIGITALALVISIGFLLAKAAAQSDKYSKMLLTGAYGFRAIYFAEKTVKLARTVVGSTLMSVSCDRS